MSLFIRILLGSLFVIGISGCAPAGDSGGEEAPADSMPMEEASPMVEATEAMPLEPAAPADEMADEMSDEMSDNMGEDMPAEGDDAGDMSEDMPAEASDEAGDMADAEAAE